jgi:hypothetical protein
MQTGNQLLVKDTYAFVGGGLGAGAASAGEAQGVDAVIARCQIITSYGLNFALKHVLYGQFGFALSLNNTAKCGDIVLDEHLATVCSLREEKIDRIDTYLSDLPMANAFFA